MKIGSFEIGSAPYLIAECSINHCGHIDYALEMIAIAKKAGCDAVKFQTYKTEQFCQPDDPMYETFKQCELPPSAWETIAEECRYHEITFLSTPQNASDLELLLPLGMPAIKVGSDDALNWPLLQEYVKHGVPLIVSTGMCDERDIFRIEMNLLGRDRVLMLCTSQYPTEPEEVNLSRLPELFHRAIPDSHRMMGFSDHTRGNTASIMAVALGATVLERHFTPDRNLTGPEHLWACDPAELHSWVTAVHEAWAMRGTGSFQLSQRESDQKRKYQRKAGQQLRGAI